MRSVDPGVFISRIYILYLEKTLNIFMPTYPLRFQKNGKMTYKCHNCKNNA